MPVHVNGFQTQITTIIFVLQHKTVQKALIALLEVMDFILVIQTLQSMAGGIVGDVMLLDAVDLEE